MHQSCVVGNTDLSRGLLVALLLLTSGCGRAIELGEIEGTVLLDGQPLADVLVTFAPASQRTGSNVRSMGRTNAAGRFEVRAETQQPGALVGEHVVILEDRAIYSAPRSPDGTVLAIPQKRFPAVYGDPARSPLRVIVEGGADSQTVTIEAISNPSASGSGRARS